MADGLLDDHPESFVARIARIDAVFGQGLGALWVLAEQKMPVEMKIPDDRHADASRLELFDYGRDSLSGGLRVDGDAHELAAGLDQGDDLLRRGHDIVGGGIGHRLHGDGVLASKPDTSDVDRGCESSGSKCSRGNVG